VDRMCAVTWSVRSVNHLPLFLSVLSICKRSYFKVGPETEH
jgi:hypothetical protein